MSEKDTWSISKQRKICWRICDTKKEKEKTDIWHILPLELRWLRFFTSIQTKRRNSYSCISGKFSLVFFFILSLILLYSYLSIFIYSKQWKTNVYVCCGYIFSLKTNLERALWNHLPFYHIQMFGYRYIALTFWHYFDSI